MSEPHLTFFVELQSDALGELFETPGVIDFLVRGGHALSMGLLDLDESRAEWVRALNARGVPVTAWLLLSEADGYWMNADNAAAAHARYREFTDWCERENLQFTGIGLDIEPPREDLEHFLRKPVISLLEHLSVRRPPQDVYAAQQAYDSLVRRMRADGHTVESYQLTPIVDERQTGSTLLRRAFGFIDVDVDREVLMLYASYLGPAMARLYFAECDPIAVGVTGGGINAENDELEPKLTWGQLRSELLAASRHTQRLYVFSLEGCVWNGMLPGLERIDWTDLPDIPPAAETVEAQRLRRLVQWAISNEALLDRVLPPIADRRPGWWKRLRSMAR